MISSDKREKLLEFQDKKFNLGGLVELDVARSKDEIVNTSSTATQEHLLRLQLEELKSNWEGKRVPSEGVSAIQFEIVTHQRDGQEKEAKKLASLDKIQAFLDDSMQKASLIAGSRYAKRL